MIQKLNKQDPKISPKAALKFPFLQRVAQDTSSGKEVAMAKNNACTEKRNCRKGQYRHADI